MSVTPVRWGRKRETLDKFGITIGMVPLFHRTVINGVDRSFGNPGPRQVGSRWTNPIRIMWDMGVVLIEIGQITEVETGHSHVSGTGFIKNGPSAQVALGSIRDRLTVVSVRTEIEWNDWEQNPTVDGEPVITNWWFGRVILSSRDSAPKPWPPVLTPIALSTGIANAPFIQSHHTSV